MTENDRLDILINTLIQESPQYRDLEIPENLVEKRNLLRALLNVRPPKPISDDFIRLQDIELQEQLTKKGVEVIEKDTAKRIYILWQGDITRVKVDAIVNAANSQMLGCFVPLHRCIDNAIHSAAGVQLRLACDEIMKVKGKEEPTGEAVFTPAFNLPAEYVIHTVGPIVYDDRPTLKECEQLASCYRRCLEVASDNNLKSVAFCCISTGEFRFPNEEAAEIAIETVNSYFTEHPDSSIKTVVFNVFKDNDYDIYSNLLKNYDNAEIR